MEEVPLVKPLLVPQTEMSEREIINAKRLLDLADKGIGDSNVVTLPGSKKFNSPQRITGFMPITRGMIDHFIKTGVVGSESKTAPPNFSEVDFVVSPNFQSQMMERGFNVDSDYFQILNNTEKYPDMLGNLIKSISNTAADLARQRSLLEVLLNKPDEANAELRQAALDIFDVESRINQHDAEETFFKYLIGRADLDYAEKVALKEKGFILAIDEDVISAYGYKIKTEEKLPYVFSLKTPNLQGLSGTFLYGLKPLGEQERDYLNRLRARLSK